MSNIYIFLLFLYFLQFFFKDGGLLNTTAIITKMKFCHKIAKRTQSMLFLLPCQDLLPYVILCDLYENSRIVTLSMNKMTTLGKNFT